MWFFVCRLCFLFILSHCGLRCRPNVMFWDCFADAFLLTSLKGMQFFVLSSQPHYWLVYISCWNEVVFSWACFWNSTIYYFVLFFSFYSSVRQTSGNRLFLSFNFCMSTQSTKIVKSTIKRLLIANADAKEVIYF